MHRALPVHKATYAKIRICFQIAYYICYISAFSTGQAAARCGRVLCDSPPLPTFVEFIEKYENRLVITVNNGRICGSTLCDGFLQKVRRLRSKVLSNYFFLSIVILICGNYIYTYVIKDEFWNRISVQISQNCF